MKIRRRGGGDSNEVYRSTAESPMANTLHHVHIQCCLPRPVSCHTPGSGAVSAMQDRHDLAQRLPALQMWCTCTPGFGYPGCRTAAVGNLCRHLPSACSVGELRRLLPSASSVGELRRQAPSASSVGKLRRQAPSVSSVSELRQQALSASSVGELHQPVLSACAVGPEPSALRRRPAPSACAVGLCR